VGATDNEVGGPNPGDGNLIAYNSLEGIQVVPGTISPSSGPATGNALLRNSIHSNALLGIDLSVMQPGSDGVTPNDAFPDADGLQNFPVLTTADVGGSSITVEGSLATTADTGLTIELFSSVVCDATGNGEGRSYLGSVAVVTNASGDASIPATVLPAAAGRWITATATPTTPASCGNGLCEPWAGENCLDCSSDCDGDQSGQPASQYCCGDGAGTNPVDCTDTRCSAGGFVCRAPSGTSEFSACFASTCATTTVLGQTVTAPDKDSLEWTSPTDVRFVKGNLADVNTYATTGEGVRLGATSLDISADSPAAGTGLYYIVRPELCGSWQTSPAAEPERDVMLP
jgi:hypothetical protein